MSFPDSEFITEVGIASYLGDSAVEPLFGEYAMANCYWEPISKAIISQSGTTIAASVLMICGKDVQVHVKDRVNYGSVYEVVQVDAPRLGGVTHHQEVYLAEISPMGD